MQKLNHDLRAGTKWQDTEEQSPSIFPQHRRHSQILFPMGFQLDFP